MGDPLDRDRDALAHVRSALAGLQFGEVVIAVHDGEIVQISRTEKIRTVRAKDRSR